MHGRQIRSAFSIALLTFGLNAQPAMKGVGIAVGSVKQWPDKPKRWALVVGVDRYQDPQIGSLHGADNDAQSLRDALVKYAGFPPDQVVLLATDQPPERQPTRGNILRRLSNLAGAVPTDGLLLVAFSGHGIERHDQAFLLPADAQLSDDVSLLEETAVSVQRMKQRIRDTGVSQVVLLIDACRNDPGGRADAPNRLSEAYTRALNFDVRNREVAAFATLFATAVGQRAYEYSEKRLGYFTWAVVQALSGGAANVNGEVSLGSLLRYVQEAVPKRIAIDLGTGRDQRPFAVIEGYKADDLIIAAVTKTSLPTAVPGNRSVELELWDSIKDSSDVALYRDYLRQYPEGAFTAVARARIAFLPPTSASSSSSAPSTALPLVTAPRLEQTATRAPAFLLPRLSPAAAVSRRIGDGGIEIAYSRPSARGRVLFGGLVPWGKVYRAGANEATVFTAFDDVLIEGRPLRAGRYSLFLIPTDAEWTFIFNTVPDQWGAFSYDASKDALRVTVKSFANETFRESLLFRLISLPSESVGVVLEWGKDDATFRVDFPKSTGGSRKDQWSQTIGLTKFNVTLVRAFADSLTVSFDGEARLNGVPLPAGTYLVARNGSSGLRFEGHTSAYEIPGRSAPPWDGALATDVSSISTATLFLPLGAGEPFRIDVDVTTVPTVLASIHAALSAADARDWRTPYRAASFAFDNKVAADDMQAWLDRAVAAEANINTLYLKARMKYAAGDRSAAVSAAELAIKAAKPSDAELVKDIQSQIGLWRTP